MLNQSVMFFTDGANGISVESLIIDITPQLTGNTDPPSSTNVRPITCFTEATIYLDTVQTVSPSIEITIPFSPSTPVSPYTYMYGTLNVTTGVLTVDRVLRVFSSSENWVKNTDNNPNGTFFTLSETETTMSQYMGFGNGAAKALCSANVVATIQGYSNGNGFYWTKTGTPGWRLLLTNKPNATGSIDDLNNLLNNNVVSACIPLATTQVYQLAPTQVKTLLGNNAIWCNTGNINTLTYRADVTLFVEKKIGIAQSLMEFVVTANRTNEMIAPSNLSADELIVACGKLYKITQNIASGATLIPNTNIIETNIAAELAAIS